MLTLSHGANREPKNIQLKGDAYMQQVMSLASMIYSFFGTLYWLPKLLLLKIRSSWPLQYCVILEYLPLLSFVENAPLCWKEKE